ncbi:MAG: twin-arginine translocation signal domain-containing protein [Acidobacteria bacterium]|nr:MAG: twin-arginine translocation signal domain-containing protein [Acidobacteriota bacterium]
MTDEARIENAAPGRTNAVDRRQFLKTTALVGGAATLGVELTGCSLAPPPELGPMPEYALAKPDNVIYSTCLQCHVACQIKAKIWDGALAKLSGNPYSPQNYLPHLPYDVDVERAAKADGKLCAKGQSGIQTHYDPYRLRRVLKRQGPRGSNLWRAIPFEQFIDEVVQGGQLFADVGDERHYPGFDEVWALRDPELAASLARDAARFAAGDMSLDRFKSRHRQHLDLLIDPDHPDLGPKNNGFVFDAGRIEHGRKELMKWFTQKSFGSINAFEHTTICEQSHHIAFDELTGHNNHHMKPDLASCEFVLFWGTGAYTANFGLTPMAEKVTNGVVDRGLKVAVVDPRLSNDAGKADWWLPVKPGADGALAYAMIRYILEHERYDERYLRNANRAAADAAGEPTWTNATHLVKIVGGHPLELVRASDVGLGSDEQRVVMAGGRPRAVDPDATEEAVIGDLFVDAELGGLRVKSALQLIHDEAFSRSWEEYEELTGIPYRQVAEVARELTGHGKRAAVELYRGPVQHTDGYYAGSAIILLNLLIGNPDWRGGLSKGGGHWHEFGGKPGNVYDFKHPRPLTAFGPPITREKTRYEDTSLFREAGYPAKRPWYPLSNNVYQEIIPSFAQGYPYPGKILFLHKGTPALASPAGHKTIEMLRDPERVPLFIACDIVIGETSMYADYILPDLTYLERWGTPHVTPDVNTMTSKVRQPVVAPLTEEVTVGGEPMPISLEAFLLAVAEKLGLPGFGKDAFGPGMNFYRPEDWFLKAVANIAFGDKEGDAVPDASAREMEIFRRARRHLPASVFDEDAWRRALRPGEFEKVVYVLNRGGRFAPFESAYDGDKMKRKMGSMWHVFVERVARQRNSMSGEYFSGVPLYRGQFDAAGKPLDRGGDYPFTLITYKEAFGGQSRTISNYWSNVALMNENGILIHRRDAERLGLADGDRARLTSASNPEGSFDLGDGRRLEIAGRVMVREGIRPGVVAVSWHYGHWAYGSNDVQIDGIRVPGDPRRAKGLCPNPVMAVDPILGDVSLTDPIGASSSFFDTPVRVERLRAA